MSSVNKKTPIISKNKPLQDYYTNLESRIGYKLVLGGTRHFGFYTQGSYWPFPISRALRAIEDHLIATLALEKGSKVLYTGCRVGHVATYLAKNGYCVHRIDIVKHYLVKARQNIKAEDLEGKVTVTIGNYHYLNVPADKSFDGINTIETFVYTTKPKAAAIEFFCVLRPGDFIAMYEYDHVDYSTQKIISQHVVDKY